MPEIQINNTEVVTVRYDYFL